ncbi:hypothetical protein [Selenomonas ruminantium]|uniref:hypothetical protein n=1 Tax=Selenomonas ruminantium TaxID=971 RepID=UPI0026EB4A15|nr:hypothetical protein [Selenomonas ruminantium]
MGQTKEKNPDMSVSELLREQIQLLAEWNKTAFNNSSDVEFAEQARRNVETIYKVSTYLEQSGSVEPDIERIALKIYELLAGAQSNYNPIKDVKPASLPKILVDGVACPLPAVVTLSLSEAEEMVHENKDELLARQRNDRKGIEYHLS